jgi:hypothetical protein
LLEGFLQSKAGFLFYNIVKVVKVFQATVKKDMDFLQDHAVIACFVGSK